ncbi:hypothetical protein BRADI_4g15400v3 [Brachypodium distachyon]|uniref:Bifunctional inhibitor/plant lipid transfer protein/seed storage helical domain-containing protein n=1 Tax=Brachypodium distachyon TaxID=15368 RepID=A0A0Q3PFG7_BRADI|nr:hypothetical protein BRADI_4g15400v3 [Brachypodium distachyon]
MAKLMCLLLVVLAIAVTTRAESCDKYREDIMRECLKYEKFPEEPKLDPSEACCAVWQKADIPCLCKLITKKIESVCSMEKVAYIVKFCNKPFAPGYKCGIFG